MRAVLCLIALALSLAPLFSESLDGVLADRLEASSTYRQALLKLKAAELAERQYSEPYIPTLSMGSSGQTSIGAKDGAFTGATIEPALKLSGLLGADLALKAPLTISKTGEFGLGSPSLSLTRKLFTETAADAESAKAALLRAQVSLKEAQDGVLLQLVKDVADAFYFIKLQDANRSDLAVLERVKNATTDATDLRELERRILQAQKSILSASGSLEALDPAIVDQAESLYAGMSERSATWTAAIPATGGDPSGSATIRAQELDLSAAEKRSAFSILPYLPNPSITADLSYDLGKSTVSWGLGLQFSIVVLDKGERALSALQRKEGAVVARLQLDSTRKDLKDKVRKARDSLTSLEIDRKLKAIDIAEEEETVAALQALFDGGYSSEEDLIIGQTDLSILRLAALKLDNDVLIQKIKLAQYYTEG